MNLNHPAPRSLIVLSGLWLVYLLSFEMPIPEERALFWLGRAIATLMALLGLVMAFRGNAKWRTLLGIAAAWLLVVYAMRTAWLLSDAANLDLARGTAGPFWDLSRLTFRTFMYLWVNELSPVRALRFAYVEVFMPLSQILVLAWLVWLRTRTMPSSETRS